MHKLNFAYWIKLPTRIKLASIVLIIYLSIGIYYQLFKADDIITSNVSLSKAIPPLHFDNLKNWHWLGTDNFGRDLLEVIIRGSYISFIISGISVLLSTLLGTLLGSMVGYFGDTGLRLNKLQIILLISAIILSSYWISADINSFTEHHYLVYLIRLTIFSVIIIFLFLSSKLAFLKHKVPIDGMHNRFIAVINSIPGIFAILFFISIFEERSIHLLVLIISFILIPTIIRIARSETIKLKNEEFVIYSKSIGKSDWKIIVYDIIPNIIQPVLVIAIFAFVAAVMLESSISFLGLGLPVEEVSWGKTIAQARDNIYFWWLAIFPGLMIFSVIWSLNTLRKYFG